MRETKLLCFLLCASLPTLAQAPIKTKDILASEARKAGIPPKLGAWTLVRYVPSEHAHFLYANQKRTFSLFITNTQNSRSLQPQKDWQMRVLVTGLTAFLYKDSRHPERTAIVYKHQTQRRLMMGNVTEAELTSLAKQLR